MKELTRVERAAVAAHARGDDWTQFWDTHRHAIALAEPWDRQRFHRLVRQLTSLVVAGNADGEPLSTTHYARGTRQTPRPRHPACGRHDHVGPLLVVTRAGGRERMSTTGQDAADDQDQDDGPCYLTLVRPRCPDCGSPNFRAYKTARNGAEGSDDDSKVRYSRCLKCHRPVVIVVE